MRATLLLLTLAGPAAADAVTIPVVGRPMPFFGAAGHTVTATAAVEPTAISRDQSCTLTLRLGNLLNAADVRRPTLEDFEDFQDFQVTALPDGQSGKDERVFRYELRPRRVGTLEVPVIAIAYYDPRRQLDPFRKARTEAVPVTVTKPAEPPPVPPTPLDVPDFAETLADAPAPWATPRYLFRVLGVLTVPLVALGGYFWWKNPGDDVHRRRLRSRVARRTVRHLRNPSLTLDELTAAMREYFETCGGPADDFTAKTDELRFAPAASLTVNDLRLTMLQAVQQWEA